MRISFITALVGLTNYACAQKINLAFIKAARPDRPTTKIAADKPNQTIDFDETKAIANVVANIRESPLADSKQGSVQVSDSLQRRDEGEPIIIELVDLEPACTPLDGTLYGDIPDDTEDERVQKFISNATLYEEALNAATPEDYTLVFQNLTNSTIQANGYLGYYVLSSYNVSECAQKCSDTTGCSAFNIYFERGPSKVPGLTCENPVSILKPKCALWGGPISAGNALNQGQYRVGFHVVMTASNGYVLSSDLGPLSTYAVDAPLDCNAADTYMGFRIFETSLPFSEELCAAACSETSRYALEHPPSDSTRPPQLCNFYSTYVLSKNSISQGQICAMYSQYWDPSVYATNGGQYDGEGNHFTIANSKFSGNITLPICPANITDLRLDTEARDFCTSYISYAGPSTVITTVPGTSTTFAACSTTSTSVTASETTFSSTGPIPRFAKRSEPKCEVSAAEVAVYPEKVDNSAVDGSVPAVITITGQDVCSSGVFSSAAAEATAQLEAALTSPFASVTGIFQTQQTPAATAKPEATINKRQGQATPSIFEGRDYRVISSACSRIVDIVTTQTQIATPVAVLEPEYDCSDFSSTCSNQTTHTIINGQYTDDTAFDLNLPFEICIYDTCDTRVRPSSNGLITLGDTATSAFYNDRGIPSQFFPTNTAALYVFWDDLVVDDALSSYMQYVICNDTSRPSVRFEWKVRRYATSGPVFSFSASFFSGQNNTVLLQYDDIPDRGISASVGAQGVRNGTTVSYTFAQNQIFAVAPFSTIINFDKQPTV